MNNCQCISINLDFAFFEDINDNFIGQKVIVKCDDKQVIGSVSEIDLAKITVRLFGDASGFVLQKTVGIFYDSFIDIPLSPSILGRYLNFFGDSLNSISAIIPVAKTDSYYVNSLPKNQNSELVGESDWLIKSEIFELQKGEVKSGISTKDLIPLLGIPNLALVIVELDPIIKSFDNLHTDLSTNQLDTITVYFQSTHPKDLTIAPFAVGQVTQYLSGQLGFDVLVIVQNSDLAMEDEYVNFPSFYFTSKFKQLATFGQKGSVSVIYED